jgi:hypothetical protein
VRENDGRKLDHQTLEVLRLRAVEQVQASSICLIAVRADPGLLDRRHAQRVPVALIVR